MPVLWRHPDIRAHRNEPAEAAVEVCNWLKDTAKLKGSVGASHMWGRFNEFMAANYVQLQARRYSDDDIRRQSVPDLVAGMRDWIAGNPLEV